VMGKNPSHFSAAGGGKERVKGMDTKKLPVERVSWDDAVEFCRRLSALPEEEKAGRVYRLPTEAEAEYACRAGTRRAFHYGDKLSSKQANFDGQYAYGGAEKGEYLGRPVAVNSKGYEPNEFGLYHMHGNVWEWCLDLYDKDYYASGENEADPRGPMKVKE